MPSTQTPSSFHFQCHIGLLLCTLAAGCSTGSDSSDPGALAAALHALPRVRSRVAHAFSIPRPTPEPACPAEMARVNDYCIDRFEAHIVEVVDGVERVHPHNRPVCRNDALGSSGRSWTQLSQSECENKLERIQARSSDDVYPQGYMSQIHAARACQNAGKRLCTRKEWMAGCQGRKAKPFPYGESRIPGACNSGKPHVLSILYGRSPGGWTYAAFNDERLTSERDFLEKTGAYLDCVSDYGIFDMVGNLQEWVSDRTKYGHSGGRGVFVGSHAGNRGDEMGPGCHYLIRAHEPSYHDYSIGFRCCSEIR